MLNGIPYHEECTHGPDYKPLYGNIDSWTRGCQPVPTMTEERVRQIVREEIESKLRQFDEILKDRIERGLGVRP